MFRLSANRFFARLLLAVFTMSTIAFSANAQSASPFEYGWVLDPEVSVLNFLSVKKSSKAEISSFATLSGIINEAGEARISILMDSIDTKVDLRNVRMRFLFFETFKFPESTITAQINASDLTDLGQKVQKYVILPYTVTVHGVTIGQEARVRVTLLNNDRVSVSSVQPIPLALSLFNLEGGRQKLQETANVDILPFGTVTFDFTFDRARPGTAPQVQTVDTSTPGAAALETKGNFDREACLGRFEILSRAGNIYFRSGSARLDQKSIPLLQNLLDIVRRCPDLNIQVSGHTDSDGPSAANQLLSEARAHSVAMYLRDAGIPSDRIETEGYGETRPVVPNTTSDNKRRNRRIEFSVLN